MQKRIGKVILDYSYYKGEDLYSDGEIEDLILKSCKEGTAEELLHTSNRWPILYHLSDIRENIIEWYPFKKDADILEIGSGCGALTGILHKKSKSVTCIDLSEKRSLINAYRNREKENIRILLGNFQDIKIKQKFDYVTLIGVWEYAGLYVKGDAPYHKMLEIIKTYLKKDGKILIAIENKMGMKYWNGAAEDHTGKMYSGINDYIGDKQIRTFSKMEIEEILEEAGISQYCFYYPMPDYKLPDCIYTEQCAPHPGDLRYYRQDYTLSRLYNFFDATAADQISRDKIFPYFANSFFFVCGDDKKEQLYVKYSRTRKNRFQIVTSVFMQNGRKKVSKRAVHPNASYHVIKIKENEKLWTGMLANLQYVHGEIEQNAYIVPYIEGRNAAHIIYEYRHDSKKMLQYIRDFFKQYLWPDDEQMVPFEETESFVSIFGHVGELLRHAKCLKVTNIDILFSNLLFTDHGIWNIDYEWVFDFPVPYEYTLWRSVNQLYDKYAIYLRGQIDRTKFLIEAGIKREHIGIYQNMEKHFERYVYGDKYLEHYQKQVITQTIHVQ